MPVSYPKLRYCIFASLGLSVTTIGRLLFLCNSRVWAAINKKVRLTATMLREKAEVLDERSVSRAVARISFEILERNRGIDDLCIIGIITRGKYLAKRIAEKIEQIEGKAVDVGVLDITPYRDDIKDKDNIKDLSDISFSIEDKRVLLVDDVIYTGRSVRAAIDAIMERGRPRSIQLAALIDRGHRELPIRADYIGKNLPTSSDEVVKVLLKETDGQDKVAIYAEVNDNGQNIN